jgi:signal transduction histidine kinase/DNA-binding response OmpR family regulator
MTVLNTEMHVVNFIITVFEGAMLFFASIWYLSRPQEKARRRYVILLALLILYNIFSGLFPDSSYSLPIKIQITLAYLGGFSVSMYFVYYIYQTLQLSELKMVAIYGMLGCLFLPFIALFVVPYMINGDLEFSRRAVVIIPFGFSIFYLYILTKHLWPRYKRLKSGIEREEMAGLYLSVVLWATLPIIVFYDGSQLLEHSITNTGFMIMSVVYVRSAIFRSRKDHYELQRSKRQLEKSNELLQEKVEARTRELKLANEKRINSFINLMHETKTPLTLINHCLQKLVDKYGQSEEMDITTYSLEKLNRNMNNFFDARKLERGIHIYDHSLVTHISKLVNENIEWFNHWAKGKGIKITAEVKPEVISKADPEAINRILENLLENAIKYSNPAGDIYVQLDKVEDTIILSVRDNGPGIHPENRKKIFEPYYQVDHKKKNTQGIGMGLALVKRTVESLNGDIDLIRTPGEGTEVIVRMQWKKSSLEELESLPKNGVIKKLNYKVFKAEDQIVDDNGSNIMIIEDNAELLYLLNKQLSNDFNIYVSANGIEALEKLKEIAVIPDLIVTDVMMDEMDGFAFVKSIREQKRFQHIPIIFITAISEQQEKLKGLRLGAVDFVSKPFSIDELKLKIESILGLHEQQRMALMEQAFASIRTNKNGVKRSQESSFYEKCRELKLSEREAEVVKYKIEKYSYREIAEKLHISRNTVSSHLDNISAKLGTVDRLELADMFGKIKI